jgi:hypothetical protein
MVSAARDATVGWKCDAVSIGYSGIVVHGRPIIEPCHLVSSWQGGRSILIVEARVLFYFAYRESNVRKIDMEPLTICGSASFKTKNRVQRWYLEMHNGTSRCHRNVIKTS